MRLFIKILLLPPDDPRKLATFVANTLCPYDFGKKRVGQPRKNWVDRCLQTFWKDEVPKVHPQFRYAALNHLCPEHTRIILDTASSLNEQLRIL